MKITSVTRVVSFKIQTDEDDYNEYIRYSSDHWMVLMGESYEMCYDYQEVENAYQQWLIGNS